MQVLRANSVLDTLKRAASASVGRTFGPELLAWVSTSTVYSLFT